MTSRTLEHVDQVADELIGQRFSPELAGRAMTLIQDGAGGALFERLLHLVRQRDLNIDRYDAASLLEKLFERLGAERPELGTYLMARLYGFEMTRRETGVSESVGNWIAVQTSPAAAQILLQLTSEPIRPRLKKRCEAWAEYILSRRSR